MKYRWRTALVAGLILLLVTCGVLFLRLNPNQLNSSVQAQLQRWVGQNIRVGSASLSLLHGVSLDIQDVDVQSAKQPWHLHADSIRLGLSIWHLVRGETRITSAELIHPVLNFIKSPPVKYLTMIALPKPLTHIRIRQGSIRIADKLVTQDFDGAVQRISREQRLTWELQTKFFGGDLTTQGRIQYDTQGRGTVFGKLEAKHIHVKKLSEFTTTFHIVQAAYGTFGTSLTFDVNPDHEWHVFGDATLHARQKNSADIVWRGKLNGAGWQQLNWHDSFLQISQNNMFSTVGACAYGRGCHFGVDTRNADISSMLGILNLDYPLAGQFDIKSSCSWKHGQWSIAAQLASHHVSWSDIALPDANISIPDVRYHAPEGLHIANVHIQTGDSNSNITINRLIQSDKAWNLDAYISNDALAWVPLANILLKAHGIKADLQGKGAINADIKIAHVEAGTGMDISMHASRAQISYGKAFKKPGNIPFDIIMHADITGDNTLLNITHVTLGNSHIKRMQWLLEQRKSKSLAIDDMYINLTALRQHGIVLPDRIKDWHGAIGGHFTRVHPSMEISMSDPFAEAAGQLELTGFGVGKHQWNGVINMQNGTLSTRDLVWRNADQHARLTGSLHLASRQGSLDLQDATFTLKQGDMLPVWLRYAKLHGHLRHTDVNWMGTSWHELYGTYRTSGNRITFKKVRAKLAGGSARSPKISLTLTPASVHFSGSMHMAIIRLNKLSKLSEALGTHLDGYMYLNANLEGDIPWHATSGWQGNGDIEIQHGHWRPDDKKLAITVGNLHTELGKEGIFSRFSTRFHLRHNGLHFTRMQLESGVKQITGKGVLHTNGALEGTLKIKDEHGSRQSKLTGNWPELTGFFGQ